MLQIESIIKNYDNTGIITGKVIHIYRGGKKGVTGKLNDAILIASQKKDFSKLTKRKITQAVIVKTKKKIKRLNGHYIKFKNSGFVTLQEKDTFKATSIKGPIAAELRYHPAAGIITTAKVAL